jgi:hypothetical protein
MGLFNPRRRGGEDNPSSPSEQSADNMVQANTSGDYGVPDYVEPMYAWRSWVLRRETVFGSVTIMQAKWRPGEIMRATCAEKYGHKAPEASCRCGIYAVKTPDQPWGYISDYVRERYTVMSIVALWGKVIEGPQGWRAEFCYPQLIILIPPAGAPTLRYPSPYPEDPRKRVPIGRDLLYKAWRVPVLIGPRLPSGWTDFSPLQETWDLKLDAHKTIQNLRSWRPPVRWMRDSLTEWGTYKEKKDFEEQATREISDLPGADYPTADG